MCVCVCVLHVDVALEFFFMCITSNHASAILQSEGTAETVSSYHVIDHASVILHSVETDKIVSSICDISCVNNLIPGGAVINMSQVIMMDDSSTVSLSLETVADQASAILHCVETDETF